MRFELDHLFVATPEPAAAEREMAAFGIGFTRRTVHAGQGTANACASFEGTFLELLWAHDATELQAPAVRPLGLDARIRWRETGACPFGLAFRPEVPDSDAASWPFPTWRYEAPYFPPGLALPVVTPADRLDEPLVFIMRRPRPGAPGGLTAGGASPAHRGAPRTVTRLAVQSPPAAKPTSPGLRWFTGQGLFALASGLSPLLEMDWDGAGAGQSHRFSEAAPVLLRW